MKKNSISVALIALLLAVGATAVWSQTVGTRVQGTVADNGKPAAGIQVVLTNEDNGRSFKAKTDKNGRFDMVGIPIGGNYKLEAFSPTGESLWKRNKVLVTNEGGDIQNFQIDYTDTAKTNLGMANETGTKPAPGPTGQPKMTKEQIEAIKAQNAKAQGQNALITQAITALNAKQWQEAVSPLQQLIAADPNRYEFYQSLGDAQFNLGQFEEATQTYEKGVQVANSNTAVDPKNPATDPAKKRPKVAAMLTQQGNAFLKLKKNKEATEAFTKAAAMDPNPGTAYFNLCATQYNTGNSEGALQACDKAIAADPNRADAYFIKGSVMMGNSKQDKDGKLEAPPGTADSLNKYLELQPDGPHAGDVKQMLAAIGAKIETNYSTRKKK